MRFEGMGQTFLIKGFSERDKKAIYVSCDAGTFRNPLSHMCTTGNLWLFLGVGD